MYKIIINNSQHIRFSLDWNTNYHVTISEYALNADGVLKKNDKTLSIPIEALDDAINCMSGVRHEAYELGLLPKIPFNEF